MNSFGELFNRTLKDRSKWDYYDDTYFYCDEYQDVLNNSRYFIQSILSNGEKLSDLAREQYGILNDGFRLEHTVSLYFMGIIIYENVSQIRSNIDKYIRRIDRSLNRYNYSNSRLYLNEYVCDTPFSYIWFLICFYHDFGYSFETEDKRCALERLFEVLNGNLNFILPKGRYRTGVPKVISDIIQNYVIYRYKMNNKLDHGIVAGLLFWEERKKDYLSKKRNHREESFIEDNRLWSRGILYNIHLPVAWTISAHNIWFIGQHSKYADDYRNYGLESLIIDRPKIQLAKYPMLFLLSIVDTIDPVKLLLSNDFHNFKLSDLNFIEFEFNYNTILYRLDFDDKVVNSKYKQSVKNIDTWLCCNSQYKDRIFEIKI